MLVFQNCDTQQGSTGVFFCFSEVWQSVKGELQREKWHRLPPIPRETNFQISVLNDDIMMEPDTYSQVLDVEDLQKQMAFTKPEVLELKYDQTNIRNIEDIFDLNKSYESGNQSGQDHFPPFKVQVLGEAGTGKSTHVQRLACKWAKGLVPKLGQYKGIFLIPVKQVKHNCLVDALSDIEEGLGFVKAANRQILDKYLKNPTNAGKVLLILDGVDETELKQESDLHRVLFGELYLGVHVMLTMRHYSDKFSPQNGFIPTVRVHLKGTDRTSIERFIGAFFSQESQQTTSYIITECQSRLFDYSIAYIPLYLTMICFIFHEQRALHSTITHFKIPETMTGVFHAFLHVILRFWLKRLGRSNEICLFEKSPILGQTSQVPIDIQKTLYLISKMSFDGLIARKYTFDASEISQYVLSENDIKNSGLFCVREMHGIETFFFRHKTLQEYLGGLYLAKDFEYISSFQMMLGSTEQSEPKKILYESLEPLQKCLQFASGVSDEFLQNLLSQTTGKTALQKLCSKTVKYNINFETSLYFEANSIESLEHMVSYLEQAPVVSTAINVGSESTTYDLKCLRYFIHHLNDEHARRIVERLYGIGISTDRNGVNMILTRNGVNCSSPRLQGDLLLFALITRFVFPMVSNAKLEMSTTDLAMLLKSFPNLEVLELKAMVLESTFLDPFPGRSATKSLKNVSLKSVLVPVILNKEEAETNLLAQPNLTHLKLSGVNMLRHLTCQQLQNVKWYQLTELYMTDCALNANDSALLCNLFHRTPDLKVLDLSNYHSYFHGGHTQLQDSVDIIAGAIVECLPKIEVLGFADCLGPKSVTNFTMALPRIQKLRVLTLDKRDIKGAQTNLTEGLLASKTIKQLLVYSRNSKKESIKRELKAKLEQKGIHVKYISLYD